jgi:hypothetical protein
MVLSNHGSSYERINRIINDMNIPFKGRVSPERPSKEVLEKIIWDNPVKYIAEDYKVTDKTIRVWCKKYGISTPPQGYWSKINKTKT